MKYRLRMEVAWLLALADCAAVSHVKPFTSAERRLLLDIAADFDDRAAERIKAIEARTRHDVKAVEYYLRERLDGSGLSDASASLHFACTSDDINNLAYALMFRDALRDVWLPRANALMSRLERLVRETAAVPLLARTHGQAATPTTVGKELAVFVYRLRRQLRMLEEQQFLGKFNGAVGAYNAHHIAYPDVDWRGPDAAFRRIAGLGVQSADHADRGRMISWRSWRMP